MTTATSISDQGFDLLLLLRRYLRGNVLWAVLLSASFTARTALDWFVPTTDFQARSTISTAIGVSVLVCAGFAATWRSRFVPAGAIAGAATALVAAALSALGTATLLTIGHDAPTLQAIEGSGGLGEAFVLPLFLAVPGVILGAVGGLAAAALRRFTRT